MQWIENNHSKGTVSNWMFLLFTVQHMWNKLLKLRFLLRTIVFFKLPFLFYFIFVGTLNRHSSQSAWQGKCPHCSQDYANISSLKYHVRLVHSDAKNVICCYLCPSKFMSKVALRDHLMGQHQVKYQWNWEFCEFAMWIRVQFIARICYTVI